MVLVHRNRVVDHSTGALVVGGVGPSGGVIFATVTENDFVTSWSDSGPSNPYGIRIQSITPGALTAAAQITATVARNRIRGTHFYPILVNAGQAVRGALPWTADIDIDFVDNQIVGTPIVTFTNSRMVELPCDLDPTSVRGPDCPLLQPGVYYTYLVDSTFTLDHTGELDGILIDHPETHPIDGHTLGNVLVIDGETVPHQTLIP